MELINNPPDRIEERYSVGAKVLVLELFLFSCHGLASAQDVPTFGTLIGAFGNSNGIVVVTDSMASFRDANGVIHQLPNPAQKLLKYDDRTVCAIAGLGTASVPAAPELNADLLGVVQSYRDGIQEKNIKQPIAAALVGLSATLQFYLSGTAEINARTGNEKLLSDYHLQVLLVGYDLDGSPKIGELVLSVEPIRRDNGNPHWTSRELQKEVIPVEKGFKYSVGGMNDVALKALRTPREFQGYAILDTYQKAMAKDAGATLPLSDIEELARALISMTAEKHVEVGKDRQVAVLESGQISRLVQPAFPPPKKPFPLVVHKNGFFQGGSVVIRGDVVVLFESTRFIGMRPEPIYKKGLTLDGNVFVDCTFSNYVLWYNGGSVYFDKTNHLSNSELALGANAFQRPDIVRSLQETFSAIQKP